jgi:hypothetical protein
MLLHVSVTTNSRQASHTMSGAGCVRLAATARSLLSAMAIAGALTALEIGSLAAASPLDRPRADEHRGADAPTSWALRIDNDLFSGAHSDQDYSWGLVIGTTPRSDRGVSRWLGNALNTLTGTPALGSLTAQSDERRRGSYAGLIALTPGTLRSSDPIPGDRPFASLVFLGVDELATRVDADRRRYTSLTVGALGTTLAPRLHGVVHRWVGDEHPQGWSNQVSAGGEPTIIYRVAWIDVIAARSFAGGARVDISSARSMSIGALTYVSASASARLSRGVADECPEYSELLDYGLGPLGCESSSLQPRWSTSAGVRAKIIGYNALLQGQFRDSALRVRPDNLRRTQGEAWLALEHRSDIAEVSYFIRYATRELRRGVGARDMIWAGFTVSPPRR